MGNLPVRSSKNRSTLFILNFWLVVFSLSIYRLPIAFGYRFSFLAFFIGIIPYAAGIVFNVLVILKRKKRAALNKRNFIILCFFAVLWILALMRTFSKESNFDALLTLGILASWLVLGLFIFLVFLLTDEYHHFELIGAMIYGLGFYVFLNLAMYFFGINPPGSLYLADYPAQMLSIVGISKYRVLFPMASGINSFGTVSGAGLVGLFFLFKKSTNKLERSLLFFLLVFCLLAILLTDSRGALIFSLMTIGLFLLPKKVFCYARWIPFLISIFILLIIVIPSGFFTNWLPDLDRPASVWENSDEIDVNDQCERYLAASEGLFSNRSIIWRFAINDLGSFNIQQLIGFGFRGQYYSGLNANYACLFKSYAFPQFASLHQNWLQLVFDIGYLGLLFTLALLVLMVRELSEFNSLSTISENFSLASILCYIVLSGSLEAIITPDAMELFLTLTFILISFSFSKICPSNNVGFCKTSVHVCSQEK
jgi:hypothetical protein